MTATLDKVVPWGRSFDEYARMFDLSDAELATRILDCAGGPSSFNAEMFRQGRTVVSCDPLYQFSATEIAQRIEETFPAVLDATGRNREKFVWREIPSPEELGELRMRSMRQFLGDFETGIAQHRYRIAALPVLPFAAREFDLALCSHFLFTYATTLGLEFHLASIRELCRISAEVRIFPLVEQFGAGRSDLVPRVLSQLSAEGYQCEVRRVPYEFQRGGNEVLRLRR